MLHWLQKQLVSDETANWIDSAAGWAIETVGREHFERQVRLIQPDATDFPQKVSSPEGMAEYVLQRVTQLTGVAHWPWQLVDVRIAQPAPPALLPPPMRQLHAATGTQPPAGASSTLQVPFVIDQVSKPQDLLACIAHTCAQHMLWQSQQTPPGGMEYFEQAAEILAVFSGFGLVLTNTAYTYRGSCARCYNPRANRQASLSEAESVYALALFCHLKNTPDRLVFKYLKPHLKGSFKLALKQIRRRAPLLPPRSSALLSQ